MRRFLLALLAALSCGPGWSLPAGAVEVCEGYSSYNNPFACCSRGNCTWWARYMRPDLHNVCTGNPKVWLSQAQSGGFQTSSTPIASSLAVFNNMGSTGHVAFVISVNSNNSFYVSEMGCESWIGVRYKTYAAGSASGFIHFKPVAANINVAQQKITACRNANTWLGSVVEGIHEWHPTGGNGRWVYIVDYQNGSAVFDMIGGAAQAFAVPSYFMGPWAANQGCAGSKLGCPIGGRYSWNSGTRQDFESGYLFYKSGINIGPYTWNGSRCGPGILQRQQRSHLFSYRVSDCYTRNGGRNTMGLPVASLPHLHPVPPFSALIQDFTEGSWSSPIIIYDTQAPLYASVVYPHLPSGDTMNQACELHGAFRSYWESHGRFTGVGYPFTDEYSAGGIVRQRFIKRSGGRWIGTELRYQSGNVTAVQIFNQQVQGEEPEEVLYDATASPELPELGADRSVLQFAIGPNPTSGECQIYCTLPGAGNISLSVFDSAGRLIRQLATLADHPAGTFQFSWDGQSDDGQHVSTGVYFVRLTADGVTQNQQLVVVR